MRNGRKAGKKLFMLLAVLITAMASISAQQRTPTAGPSSNNAQIFLMARMPETLSLAFNVNDINVNDIKDAEWTADSGMSVKTADVRPTAASVTATWVLAPGRSRIVAWAHVQRPPARVLLAFASSIDIPRYGGEVSDSPLGYGFAPRASVASRKLDALNITGSNRVAANTVSLSDSIEITPAELPEDAHIGTVKIQVEAVP